MTEGRNDLLAILCLCAIVISAFAPVLQCGFTNWDDQFNITENRYLGKGVADGLVPLISHNYLGLYVPATYALYWVEYHLWGLSSFGFHLVNLLCHAASVALVYLIFRRLLPDSFSAGVAALWWGVHPLHVEPVAWATGLKDVLSILWTLVSFRLYIAWRTEDLAPNQRRRAWLWGVSLLTFVAACLSKPGIVGFPLVLLAYDVFATRRRQAALRATTPFFVISAFFVLVTMSAQKVDSPVSLTVDVAQRLLLAADSALFYVEKLIWPACLSPVYERTVETVVSSQWAWLKILLAGGLLALVLFLGWRWKLGAAIFVAGFLPVSGVAAFEYQKYSTVADRHAYFSSLGVALMLGDLASRLGTATKNRSGTRHTAFIACLVLWILMLAITTLNQTFIWRDSFSLWNRALNVVPRSAVAFYNRGNAWLAEGDYEQAIRDFTQAIKVEPNDAESYNNRGAVRTKVGDYAGAIQDCTTAIALKVDYDEAYNNRAVAWAAVYDYEQAIRDCTRAIELRSDFVDAYYNRSMAYYFKGKYLEARSDLNRFCELGGMPDPQFAEILKNAAGSVRE